MMFFALPIKENKVQSVQRKKYFAIDLAETNTHPYKLSRIH